MKKFNLNNIGHEMPHSQPREDFFEKFPQDLYAEIEARQIVPIPLSSTPKKIRLDKQREHIVRFSAISATAAAIAIALVVLFDPSQSKSVNSNELLAIDETIFDNIDSYISKLTNDELELIISESANQRDFYTNLPNI